MNRAKRVVAFILLPIGAFILLLGLAQMAPFVLLVGAACFIPAATMMFRRSNRVARHADWSTRTTDERGRRKPGT